MESQQKYNFPKHIKGDTFNGMSFTVTVNTAALDLTGATIRMQLKNDTRKTAAKTFSTADSSIVITEPLNGKFQIAKQVIDIPPAVYVYDLQITLASGDVHTYIYGTWQILQDVTNG